MDVVGSVSWVDDNNELLSRPVARLIASWAIVFNVDIASVFAIELGAIICCCCWCCCFLFAAATAAAAAAAIAAIFAGVEPFSTLCCAFGDMRPGDVRLLTMEYVGETLFVIELMMVDTDDVDRLLFVMEVRIAWVSVAFDATNDGATLADDDTMCCFSDCNLF